MRVSLPEEPPEPSGVCASPGLLPFSAAHAPSPAAPRTKFRRFMILFPCERITARVYQTFRRIDRNLGRAAIDRPLADLETKPEVADRGKHTPPEVWSAATPVTGLTGEY